MKYRYCDAPLRVFGLPEYDRTGSLARLPENLIKELGGLFDWLGRRIPGCRVGFRTDARRLTVGFTLSKISPDIGLASYGGHGAQVLVGRHGDFHYAGVLCTGFENPHAERTFDLNGDENEVLIYLPRNDGVTDFYIEVEEGAKVLAPTPYKIEKPIVFYGSSITEGAHAVNSFNTYEAILSEKLDADFVCLGFSSSAMGELCMADYINTLDMSVFVLDYDHNAPTPEHLAATHEPFFRRIRGAHPDLPVVMMSRPAEIYGEEEIARRAIIRRTYENALASGDKNVYFVDGEAFFGTADRQHCSTDTIHPNDLGHYRMAECILPTLTKIVEEK